MMRNTTHLIVVIEGGIVCSISAFYGASHIDNLHRAILAADVYRGGRNPEKVDIVVWDLEANCAVYNPFKEEAP